MRSCSNSQWRAGVAVVVASACISTVLSQLPVSANPRSEPHSAQTINVTEADNGRAITMQQGDTLDVTLSGPSFYTWTQPSSSDEGVLQGSAGSSGSTASASFSAVASGQATVTAVDSPNCYPECLPPSLLFQINVSVTDVVASPKPHIAARPRSVMVNTKTRLTGTGFPARKALTIEECSTKAWFVPMNPCDSTNLLKVKTDAHGAFSRRFTVQTCPVAGTPPGFSQTCYIGEHILYGVDGDGLLGAAKIAVTGP